MMRLCARPSAPAIWRGRPWTDPEPAAADHPVVRLAAEFPERLVLLPHQSGITQTSFRNVYRMLFANLERLAAGEKPERIVNKM